MQSMRAERLHKRPGSGDSTIAELRRAYGAKESLDRRDSYISRFVYRPLSFYLTVPFARMGWSANQVTLLRGLLAIVSALLLAIGSRSLVLSGAILYALCVLLDYVDGNLARLQRTTGKIGELLEELADQPGPSLLPIAIGIGLFIRPDRLLSSMGRSHSIWALLVGALASLAYCLIAITTLYIREVSGRFSRPAIPGDRPSVRCDSVPPYRIFRVSIDIARRALAESVYFAIVFGIILAAAFNVMSIYLLARSLRNVTVLISRVRLLATRLVLVSRG